MFDYALLGGTVVDGTCQKPYEATVCLKDGIIADIVKTKDVSARHCIDAAGLIVAPGFIDIHSHSDARYLMPGEALSKVYQGVTLELVGNCGISLIPTMPHNQLEVLGHAAQMLHMEDSTKIIGVHDVASYGAAFQENRPPVHLAALIGHGTLRACAMGFKMRPPTPYEMDQMQVLLANLLRQGAFGLSLGLIYPPGSFCDTDELVALSRVVKDNGGMVTVHMRNENKRVLEAVEEMLLVARTTGVHMHLSHLKLMGIEQWGKAELLLEKIGKARAEGVHVTADQYPYSASSTSLSALLPNWAQEGGVQAMQARLQDKDMKGRLLKDVRLEIKSRGGPERVVVADTRGRIPDIEGMNLKLLSEAWNTDPEEAALRVLAACPDGTGGIFHAMSSEDVQTIMRKMEISVGSDGTAYPLDPSAVLEKPHCRNYGTFPRMLQTVREHQLMPIEDAVYKMTGLAAKTMGLKSKGTLTVGQDADITVFDWETIRDCSTYSQPVARPEGIRHVFVDGLPAVLNGEATHHWNGRFIHR